MNKLSSSDEIIIALKQKVAKYEAILEEILQKKKMAGTVKAGPHSMMYRVEADNNSTLFIVSNPNNVCDYKIGDNVLCNEDFILSKMPTELEVKKPMPKFNLLGWDQIGGMKSQIAEIRKSVEMPLENSKLYEEFGAKPIKGLLLYGPPGCGKTLIAKAIASYLLGKMKTPDYDSFIYVKGPELLSMYVGGAEQHVKRIFTAAKEHKIRTGVRGVIFIDEAEAILPERGSMVSSDVEKTIVPMFLSEMDGFDNDNTPFVILATNKPNHIDNAILREGRIDLKVRISRPTIEDSVDIFEIYLKKTKVAEQSIAKKAAKQLFEMVDEHRISGALISTVVQYAIENVISRKIEGKQKTNDGILMSDINHAIKKITNHESTKVVEAA